MLRAAIPTRFQKAWAEDAAGAFIRTVPVDSQIGIQDGAASYETGFVPDNFTALAAGGVPPFGQDFNGTMNDQTTWDQWYQAGAAIPYDATFATAVGGYPQGAILDSAIVLGAQWYSLVDSNTTDPDDPLTSTGWARVGIPAGVPQAFLTSTMPSGFLAMNALTLGNAASGADFADASSLFLYAHNWLNFSNTQCPIYTSAGVASTRGANPYADFAANKRLAMPNAKGLGLIGADTMGGTPSTNLAGVPVTSGNTTTPGSVLGANLHLLTLAQTPTGITSSGSNSISVTASGNIPRSSTIWVSSNYGGGINEFVAQTLGTVSNIASLVSTGSNSISVTSNNTGGGSHNNVELSMLVYWGQKL